MRVLPSMLQIMKVKSSKGLQHCQTGPLWKNSADCVVPQGPAIKAIRETLHLSKHCRSNTNAVKDVSSTYMTFKFVRFGHSWRVPLIRVFFFNQKYQYRVSMHQDLLKDRPTALELRSGSDFLHWKQGCHVFPLWKRTADLIVTQVPSTNQWVIQSLSSYLREPLVLTK